MYNIAGSYEERQLPFLYENEKEIEEENESEFGRQPRRKQQVNGPLKRAARVVVLLT